MCDAPAIEPYTVVAVNTATDSENRMHDDAVAASYGFRGGLVPGVDVAAYLCHIPMREWGRAWVDHGGLRVRLIAPVYDGELVTVRAQPAERGAISLEACGDDGVLRAQGEAQPPAAVDPPPPIPWRPAPAPGERPVAAPDVLQPGTVLAGTEVGFHSARAAEYLDAVGEHLPLLRHGTVAHPAWLVRQANHVLSATVRLGPWIHVETAWRHHSAAVDGDVVSTCGRVTHEWERKGHRFVELDVDWRADDGRALARATHIAIYQPRRA